MEALEALEALEAWRLLEAPGAPVKLPVELLALLAQLLGSLRVLDFRLLLDIGLLLLSAARLLGLGAKLLGFGLQAWVDVRHRRGVLRVVVVVVAVGSLREAVWR